MALSLKIPSRGSLKILNEKFIPMEFSRISQNEPVFDFNFFFFAQIWCIEANGWHCNVGFNTENVPHEISENLKFSMKTFEMHNAMQRAKTWQVN